MPIPLAQACPHVSLDSYGSSPTHLQTALSGHSVKRLDTAVDHWLAKQGQQPYPPRHLLRLLDLVLHLQPRSSAWSPPPLRQFWAAAVLLDRRFLVGAFFFVSFSIVKISPHCFLATTVYVEKSAVCLTWVLWYRLACVFLVVVCLWCGPHPCEVNALSLWHSLNLFSLPLLLPVQAAVTILFLLRL